MLPRATNMHRPNWPPAIPWPQRLAWEKVHVVEAKRVEALCKRVPEACLTVCGRGNCKASISVIEEVGGGGPMLASGKRVCQVGLVGAYLQGFATVELESVH